jgi:hypothetical protein
MVDNPTAGTRAKTAINKLAYQKIKRDNGVDLKALLLQASATIPLEKQGSLAAELAESKPDELEKARNNLRNTYRLNEKQLAAAEDVFLSQNGVSIIWGPPGTGKTYTQAAMVSELVRLGYKVLFACPSNKAVNAALTKLAELKDARHLKAIRFTGGSLRESLDSGSDTREWDHYFGTTADVAGKAHPERIYHAVRDSDIAMWNATENHPQHKRAKEYLAAKQELKEYRGPAEERRKLYSKMAGLEKELLDYFFQHNINVAFTTCSSACHPAIANHFRPDVVFIDEAAQATVPDACMALAPYAETVRSVVLAGDPNQLTPVVIAREANEALSIMERSLLDRLVKDPDERYGYIMLTAQYRSHPDIIAWASREFYNNELTSDPSTQGKNTHLVKTVMDFFRQLGPNVRNARRRMAVNVSSPDAFSANYQNTSSFYNREEARYIVDLVERLLAFDTPKGAKVKPEHIAILTPYKGQQSHIRGLLRSQGLDTDMARISDEGTVSTTYGVQGSEFEIVFISLCAKDKKSDINKLAFVAREHRLCVQNTRAKIFQVTFGNFAGWCKAIDSPPAKREDGRVVEVATKPFSKFRSLVLSHYYSGDIVSYHDIDRVYFSMGVPPTQPPSTSHFYKTVMPTLNDQKPQLISKTGGKRAASASGDKQAASKKLKGDGQRGEHTGGPAVSIAPMPAMLGSLSINDELQKQGISINDQGQYVDSEGAPLSKTKLKQFRLRPRDLAAKAKAPAAAQPAETQAEIESWTDKVARDG